ncbi:MAG: hypothetical protein HWD60_01205 [Defluviicoccus sp.]|nr:MAG: hypothetical protein HWD60_01205 [Defluviicoccus sp.]
MSETAGKIELEQLVPVLSTLDEALSFSTFDGAIVSADDLSTRVEALRGTAAKTVGSCTWSGWGN